MKRLIIGLVIASSIVGLSHALPATAKSNKAEHKIYVHTIKFSDYTVLRGKTQAELEANVNQAFKDGYTPIQGFAHSGGDSQYFQAVAKITEEDDNNH